MVKHFLTGLELDGAHNSSTTGGTSTAKSTTAGGANSPAAPKSTMLSQRLSKRCSKQISRGNLIGTAKCGGGAVQQTSMNWYKRTADREHR